MSAARLLVPLAMVAHLGCTASIGSSDQEGAPAGQPGDRGGGSSGPGSGNGGATPGGGSAPGSGMGLPSPGGPPAAPPPINLPDAGAVADGGASDAASGSVPPCRVTIVPVSPPRFVDLLAGPGETLRVRAEVSGTMAPSAPSWRWEVLHEQARRIEVRPVGGDPAVVELELAQPGRYFLRAEATPTCFADEIATAFDAKQHIATYWVRVTPPRQDGQATVPVREAPESIGGGNAAVWDVALRPGYPVTIDPKRTDPQTGITSTVSAYIRITSLRSALRLEGHTANRAFLTQLDRQLSYDVLIVPEGPVAPALVRGLMPEQIPAQSFMLDEGTLVSGRALAGDGAGTPIEGARILLRADALPSTLGRTAPDGRFDLRARPASFAPVILPPPDRGLPEAHLADGQRIVIGAVPVDLELRWKSLPTTALEVRVTTADGQPPAGRARVRLESEPGALPDVGTLKVGAAAPLPTIGYARHEVWTEPGGVARVPLAPRTRYRVTVIPESGAGDVALTTASIDAATAGPHRLTLARPVKVTGRFGDPALASGLTVVAVDTNPPVPGDAATAVVDSAGRFALTVAPGRSYRLFTEPAPARKLPRVALGTYETGTADLALADQRLPATVLVQGRVTLEQAAVSGAVIQVFCTGQPPACVESRTPNTDTVRPVAETVTGADGRYQLHLPDPATWNL